MNEHEWQKARDPEAMLAAAQGRLSPRKWVLLNCAVARRMAPPLDEIIVGAINAYELEPSRLPQDILWDGAMSMPGSPDWEALFSPPRSKQVFIADLYREAARRFQRRRDECSEEGFATRTEYLSHFPMHATAETWPHARPALSTAMHARVCASLYDAALGKMLSYVRKKAHPRDTPANRKYATENVRTVQKQLVRDMNSAMRAYAKPANELLGHFLHEQLGNPFRLYEFDPAWRTSDVLGLARGIEADRGFDRMAMLADALMEAGCESEPMLRHLQEAREHQRGCWVLDLILGHDAEVYAAEPLLGIEGSGGYSEPLGLAVPPRYEV